MSTPFERCFDMLGDVPGKSLEDRLTNYIGNYMALQLEGQRLRAELDQARGMVERLTDLANFIKSGYARVDVNHERFRVEVYAAALDATAPVASTEGKPDAWDAAHGCAPNATGDLSSEDFIRKMRDEEWPEPTFPSPDGERA